MSTKYFRAYQLRRRLKFGNATLCSRNGLTENSTQSSPRQPYATNSTFTATSPITPRRFSSSTTRSFDTSDYFSTFPMNQPISGILNNPNSKSSNYVKPSKNDIPSVPHTPIKKVKPVDFNNYLKQMTPLFKKYSQNKEIGTDESSRNPYSLHLPLPTPTTFITPTITSPIVDQRLLESNIELPLLETVPSIFFDPNFNLENPRTFDAVCEQTDIIKGNPNDPSISTNAILQEKLSHYLDTVEVHLTKEISLRSSSFFAALSNLQALHSETLECVTQIHKLREELARIDDTKAKKGLEIVRLKRRKANTGRLYEGIKMVAEIRSIQPMIQELLGQGDYFSALDLIDEANSLLHGGNVGSDSGYNGNEENINLQFNNNNGLKTQLTSGINNRPITISRLSNVANDIKKSGVIDLRGVKALMHFNGQLTKVYKTIGVMMENDLINMLFLDFEEHVDNVDKSVIINSLYNFTIPLPTIKKSNIQQTFLFNIDDKNLEKEDKLKQRISPFILGLYKMNSLTHALQSYRERMLDEIKKISQIQMHNSSLTAILADSKEDHLNESHSEQKLAKVLKGMSFDTFVDMLLSIYAVLLEGMRRITIYNEIFNNILNEAQNSGNSSDYSNVTQLMEEVEQSDKEIEKSKNETNVLSNSRFSKALRITTGIKSMIQKRTSSLTGKPVPELNTKELVDNTPDTGSQKLKAESDNIKSTSNNSSGGSNINNSNNSQHSQLLSDSVQIVYATADLAHVRCASMIAIRADQNAQLNQKDFYRLFNVTWAFVLECENLCGRMCYGLRGTIMSQAKAFLNHFHMEKTKQENTLVENEQWVQAEVPIDFQRIVDNIVSASVSGLSCFRDDPSEPLSSPSLHSYSSRAPSQNDSSNRHIFVEERKFFVVGCSLLLIKMLGDYLKCIVNIPALTTETMNRIIDLLNAFNSRTCQMILGAGARLSAGLKNITAKHLALASQSLGVMIALVPFIRECIRHNLVVKQFVMLTEFDRIKNDYVNHQNEIHAKLVSIMNERLIHHLRTFQSLNWDELQNKEGPNSYIESLIKETSTLHKVLNKYLPPETLQNVMTQIFKSSMSKIAEEIGKLNINTSDGKKRLIVDIQYYVGKLSTLEGHREPITMSEELEKAIESLELS
ncbi:4548_t:CDS:10 [Entrophospora sp. SA101]|nr:4548_t:CDS:10 [Entrophospora sp. SA101]